MNLTKQSVKFLLSVGLSLSIALTGVAAIPQQAQAAAQTKSSAAVADSIIRMGKSYMGTPYKFGAKTGNTKSFDCSSFTQYLYRKAGIDLPRTSKAQSKVGKYVKRSDLKPGDLVFFYSPVHHVAIYIGNGKILHTYGKPGVTISDLEKGYWSKHYTTARRVIG